MLDQEFLMAIENTAPLIAERPSKIKADGFIPGERPVDRAPFDVLPTKCPTYQGPPKSRAINIIPRTWQLQEEYLANRLGKDRAENSRLWDTAKWIERKVLIATFPISATETTNFVTGCAQDDASPDEPLEGDSDKNASDQQMTETFRFDTSRKRAHKNVLIIEIDDYDLLRLVDDYKESRRLAKVDVNRLIGNDDARNLSLLQDLPTPDERIDARKVIRTMMSEMRSLWHPVKRAIFNNATMASLGATQGVGASVAAGVGRQRVIEGLRVAHSIRGKLARQDALAQEPRKPPLPEIYRGSFMNQARGPVIRIAANDNAPAVKKVA